MTVFETENKIYFLFNGSNELSAHSEASSAQFARVLFLSLLELKIKTPHFTIHISRYTMFESRFRHPVASDIYLRILRRRSGDSVYVYRHGRP
jgi:hypothetical protein